MSTSSSNGVASIPATSRTMVQSLKEIVNCSDLEIYAMLKECNMDPNDTVHRLLSQDPFHEVKSKREKKKETKDTTESRSRGSSSTSNRGVRGGTDRSIGRGGSTQFSSNESGVMRGKTLYKKENGVNPIPSSSSSINQRSTSFSNPVSMDNTTQLTIGTSDGISLSSQPSSGFQPAWVGVPGQVSMADIVKKGRLHSKPSSMPIAPTETPYLLHNPIVSASLQSESHHELLHASQDPTSQVSDIIHETGFAVTQHNSHDDWPLDEQSPPATGSTVSEPSGASAVYADPSTSSSLNVDRVNLHLSSRVDEVQIPGGNVTIENLTGDASDGQILVEKSGGASHFSDGSYENMNSYQPQRHTFEHLEVEDASSAVSSAAANLQQLSLREEELCAPPAEDNPAVIIPNHLQVPTADCSHLSFGSFGSGISATYSGSYASKTLKSNLDASVAANASSIDHSGTRSPEYHGNEQLRSSSNENVAPKSGTDSGSYDLTSSQPEAIKHDTVEATYGHQYTFPSSVPGYSFENTTQPNAVAYSYPQANSQMHNLASFSTTMAHTNSLPSNLLPSTVQPLRESDLPYSQFLATQSMPTKYSSGMSSISGSTISMPEAVKQSVFSTPQPTAQTLPTSSIHTGPTLPQHLPLHPYSQPALPLGHFANMISYPFLPQSYTYMPSAFQQAYAGNSAYHQSPAAVHNAGIKYSLPQYKNSVSVNSLPQSAAITSGYGGFGNSVNIPGSFTLNPSTTTVSTTSGYDDAISSQYKDSNHYVPIQQNESSPLWVQGPGSRTMSAIPASTYYSLQGQNQHSGYRQVQQPSHYEALGYPNFYHSQTGAPQEHQQQTPSDGTLNSGSQGPPSQQSHQIWQHSY